MLAQLKLAEPPSPQAAEALSDRIAYFGYTGSIDTAGVTRIAAALNNAVNGGCSEICLCLSSLGGYVADGIYLYNHIRSLPVRLVAHNSGSISSIAVTVFLAAEQRYCSAHAMFMIHPTVIPSQDGMAAERLQSALEAALADDARTENILRARASIPEPLLVARRTREIYIRPEKAVQYGLVDSVCEFALPSAQQIIQI